MRCEWSWFCMNTIGIITKKTWIWKHVYQLSYHSSDKSSINLNLFHLISCVSTGNNCWSTVSIKNSYLNQSITPFPVKSPFSGIFYGYPKVNIPKKCNTMVSRSENDRQIVGFSHLNGGPHGRRATRRVCRAFVPAPVATPGRKKKQTGWSKWRIHGDIDGLKYGLICRLI